MTTILTDRQNNAIDLFKFLMAMLVVAIHTKPFNNYNNFMTDGLFEAITKLAVPFFFITTGYFIGKSRNKEVIKKQLIKTIRLYFIWSIVYLPLAIFYYYYNSTLFKGIVFYIIGFLFKGEHYFSWMLWYLLSAIYTMTILLLFKKVDERKLLVGMITVGILACILFDSISVYSGSNSILQMLRRFIVILIGNGRIFRGLIYIPTGMLLAKYALTRKKSIMLFVLGYILILIVPEGYEVVCIWLSSIGLFEIILKCKLENSPIYTLFRTLSIATYFTHMWIFAIYTFGFYKTVHYGLDSFVISVAVSMFIGIGFYFKKKSLVKQ